MCVCVGGGGDLQISKNIFIYYANIMYKYYCIALISLNDFNELV